ncbi:hypothetical protein GA0115240_107718 [Streptomyces sp. DvalAA-14]|uniref:hypothetical protein n=1 Tax=unclassified Streptomyces TaxID=2593676 RepID=UPI00081AFA0C|nr:MULTISPECIES: hypothetical protein [unclassified Streptomyces]MYS19384.1 hypothetical protein [Streptomyces sp. SID4948]SCD43233.1 hypothetical protein GA0115240_107718 [Streptomyces sp. DvalAA-14]
MTVQIDPGKLSQLGEAVGSTFCLVTNPQLIDEFTVVRDAPYDNYLTIPFSEGDRFEDLLEKVIPEPAHILVVSPYRFFQSPDPELLGGRRKLMAMACNSTPTTMKEIRHFLGVMEATSASEQGAFSDTFFELAEEAEHLQYVDRVHGTRAVLQHLSDGLVWNQQAGPLEWGDQQIVPAGEISVLPIEITDFHEDLHLPLEGEIVLRGYPILHNGTPSFSRLDQARIHGKLAAMREHAVKATVVRGRITTLEALDPGAAPAVEMLEQMFAVDSRYRIVWEIGHALNTSLDLMPGNHAMNEVYGGTEGCLHIGLGLTPFTQYHLDMIVPDTKVLGSNGTALIGNSELPTVERLVGAH